MTNSPVTNSVSPGISTTFWLTIQGQQSQLQSQQQSQQQASSSGPLFVDRQSVAIKLHVSALLLLLCIV